jgi:Spy/CpxP family protein refolding chaperone
MKQFLTRTAALAVLSAGAILAQGPLHHEGGGPGGNAGTNNPPDVATIVAREVNFLTHLLTLTTGQQTQATTIFTNALNSITPLETGITTARTALTTAIKANDTAGITTQSTAIGTAEGQITAIQARADAAFYALLTTDQKNTLNNLDGDFLDLGVGGVHLPGGH